MLARPSLFAEGSLSICAVRKIVVPPSSAFSWQWPQSPGDCAHRLRPVSSRSVSSKQLFIDDYIILSLSHAKQVLNPAVKHPDNPLLKADRPWDGSYVGLNKIIYEEDTGLFRLWYRTTGGFASSKAANRLRPYRYDWGWENGRAVRHKVDDPFGYSGYPDDEGWLLCYATSRDGIHWEKPNLGKVEFNGFQE